MFNHLKFALMHNTLSLIAITVFAIVVYLGMMDAIVNAIQYILYKLGLIKSFTLLKRYPRRKRNN